MLLVKVYGDQGALLATYNANSETEAIEKLDTLPQEVVKHCSLKEFKLRIEDENGKGCWVFAGGPAET